MHDISRDVVNLALYLGSLLNIGTHAPNRLGFAGGLDFILDTHLKGQTSYFPANNPILVTPVSSLDAPGLY